VILAVKAFDRGIGFIVRSELNESETLASAGLAVGNDFGALNGAELSENLLKFTAIDLIAKVSNVQLAAHGGLQILGN